MRGLCLGPWHDLLVLCHLPLAGLMCSPDRGRNWFWGFLLCGLEVVKPNQFFPVLYAVPWEQAGRKKSKKAKALNSARHWNKVYVSVKGGLSAH